MRETSLIDPGYAKAVVDLDSAEFSELVKSAGAFICAAGFEARAERVPIAAANAMNPLIVAYANGPSENEKALRRLTKQFERRPGYDICELDLLHVEKFEAAFEKAIRKFNDLEQGRTILLDISGFPNFAICIAVIKLRRVYPTANLVLLYTEAEEYFPQRRDFERIKQKAGKPGASTFPEFLSARAVNMFMPSMFSGVALGHHDTCLIVFAGYEPHRTTCVIDATNPSKLVMVYGEPARSDLRWRLELSRIMHSGIDDQLMKTEEITSTGEVEHNLRLLLQYYDHLYDDHVICVCPTNSKIQAVASALAWERYPDIQLTFPIPAEYLPTKFSIEYRNTFRIDLGQSRLQMYNRATVLGRPA